MNWDKLLSAKRFGKPNTDTQNIDIRSEFQKDYDRIIFSSSFRRLQNKTQVFPLPGSIFVHNRLTHSLEVASVGRSLGNLLIQDIKKNHSHDYNENLNNIPSIVSAACLAHDMGNPPFGHAGESTISEYFELNADKFKDKLSDIEWSDLINFDGNANALRILTNQFKGKRYGGFGLTYSTLASIVKYPFNSKESPKRNKFGYFQTEYQTYLDIANELGLRGNKKYNRHPLVYLVEAADDICYQIMDIEDAYKLSIIDYETAYKMLFPFTSHMSDDKIQNIKNTLDTLDDKNEKITYLRALAINTLTFKSVEVFSKNYNSIMEGTYTGTLLKDIDGDTKDTIKRIQKISIDKIYNHSTVIKIEISGNRIISTLLNDFTQAILNPERKSSEKLLNLIPGQYRTSENPTLYQQLMSVVDFISSMTDIYALELYRTMRGISVPAI
ncbi:MAG: deoxyguanosinetriphosphate triphosphohydrolase [Bacteroidales bacterium]|jgi:dGTPase|nr:deoxyguanosinetriphosphate triphosphohydrolase [Bacteroidales bacterium]